MVTEFRNEPYSNFKDPEVQRRAKEALAQVEAQLGQDYPLVIGGQRIQTEAKIVSLNPSNKDQVVGRVAKATQGHVDQALAAAEEAFAHWSRFDPDGRARVLFKVAALMRRRKMEFSAWEVVEAGKTWPEAEADVAEAIDFFEFYGREMMRLAAHQPLTRLAGEDNELYYLPLGVGAIIPPWNFPGAILSGMTAAAVVAGNTVLLKPASTTPVLGYKIMELFEEAGLPPGVINFVPGSGGEIGDYLVGHPRTRFVSFTGSRDVGVHIYELASKVQPGQRWLKRVVAEMGGKDAIIVDADADPSEAAAGIIQSAFGFQGQKCSACSRAIVLADVYDAVLDEIVRRTKALVVGAAERFDVDMGPVVDQSQYEKIQEYMEVGRREGRVVAGGGKAAGNGFFLQPTVIADVAPQARIAQEEIFGPVLAVIKARDFDHALEIANGTEFGLTGGVYSRNREHLERARWEFHVGNLYFNRKCTGAMVGAQPFGGFNMSGTDSKAGGHDYLLLFTQAKSVVERF